MKHKRVKTAHLMNMQLWQASGKDWQAMQIRRIREQAKKPKPLLSEEIAGDLAYREKQRKGWKSVIKDKRV
jgi:hypothetical protein